MSAWNYMFDYALLRRIEDLSARAARTDREARSAQRHRVDDLEREVGQLTLVCRALIGMMKEQGAFDAAVFNAALDKIDAEDGVVDGRVTPEDERPRKPASVPPVMAPTPRRKR
jgi:hypothetical protein